MRSFAEMRRGRGYGTRPLRLGVDELQKLLEPQRDGAGATLRWYAPTWDTGESPRLGHAGFSRAHTACETGRPEVECAFRVGDLVLSIKLVAEAEELSFDDLMERRAEAERFPSRRARFAACIVHRVGG